MIEAVIASVIVLRNNKVICAAPCMYVMTDASCFVDRAHDTETQNYQAVAFAPSIPSGDNPDGER